jgi:hypothetical protein
MAAAAWHPAVATVEHVFDTDGVTAPAVRGLPDEPRRTPALPAIPGVRRLGRSRSAGSAPAQRGGGAALPVAEGLAPLLPEGLRRGGTVEVRGAGGATSLMLALLGGASAQGAWCAAVGFPLLSGEAAAGYGIDLARFALVPRPGPDWVAVVGALLDSIDLVAVRLPPPAARWADGDARRLGARARQRAAVLLPVLLPGAGSDPWPGADIRLAVSLDDAPGWQGLGRGHGRLQRRRVLLQATGRGAAARRRSVALWLPDRIGGIGADGESAAAGTVAAVGRPARSAASAR